MLICRYIFACAYILYTYTVHFFLNVFILIHLYLSHELCNDLIFTLQLILACLPPTSSLLALSLSVQFCISCSPQPVKADDRPLKSGLRQVCSAQGSFFMAAVTTGLLCRVLVSFLLIEQSASRRLWLGFSALQIEVDWLIDVSDVPVRPSFWDFSTSLLPPHHSKVGKGRLKGPKRSGHIFLEILCHSNRLCRSQLELNWADCWVNLLLSNFN